MVFECFKIFGWLLWGGVFFENGFWMACWGWLLGGFLGCFLNGLCGGLGCLCFCFNGFGVFFGVAIGHWVV